MEPSEKTRQMRVLTARALLIWKETTAKQRHGHFAMGVGLETGLQVDEMADGLANDLDEADLAALQANKEDLQETLVRLAEKLLVIRPFAPDGLEGDWIDVLRQWIGGESITAIGSEHVVLIEDAFTYRFVWALEAIRVRRQSRGWKPELGTIAGAAAACVDTGLPDFRMTLLVRGGFASREAARKVVDELKPEFFTSSSMRQWLASKIVAELSLREDWPSSSTVSLWRRFRYEVLSGRERAWQKSSESFDISEMYSPTPPDCALVRVEPDLDGGATWLVGPDFRTVGRLEEAIDVQPNSVTYAELDLGQKKAHVRRIGPDTGVGR